MFPAKRKLTAFVLAGSVMALGIFVVAQSASATHIRAKSATPVNVPLVVAYNECTAPNSTHNPAFLAGGSCTGSVGGALGGKTSSFITSGDPLSTQAPSGTGAPAQFQGRLVQVVSAAAPHPPNCAPAGAYVSDHAVQPGSSERHVHEHGFREPVVPRGRPLRSGLPGRPPGVLGGWLGEHERKLGLHRVPLG
jgi:hypothetical protein